MTNHKYIAALLGAWFIVYTPKGAAQITDYFYDAQRFTQWGTIGSARSTGMGGATSALGGDFSAATLNPAGFGLYQTGELQFSAALQFANTKSDFLNSSNNANTTNLTIPSVGLVIRGTPSKGSGLSGFAFAFGFNQQENYRRKLYADGFNNHNSITKHFAQLAEGYNNGDLAKNTNVESFSTDTAGTGGLAAMAFNTGGYLAQGQDTFPIWIIDNYGSPNTYFGAFQYGKINQTLDYTERGRQNEWTLSGAFNWDDRFFLGVGLGITDLSYRMDHTFTEKDSRNIYNVNVFDTMAVDNVQFRESLTVSGIGINGKIGVIYQPLDYFRFGVSIQTPTIIGLSEKYSTYMSMQADAPNFTSYNESSQSLFDYRLLSPYRLNFGAVGIFGKQGLLSADFELTDYRTANFSASTAPGVFSDVNRRIDNNFTMGYNGRIGGEYRYKNVYFRGGYAYFSPQLTQAALTYSNLQTGVKSSISGARHTASGGVGFRFNSFSFDITYSMQFKNDLFSMYNLRGGERTPVTANTRVLTNLVFSAAIRFGGNKSSNSN